MRGRDAMRLYQGAARVWLTAAGLALLLPPGVRRGWWVPLHLGLAGSVSVAISGAMQSFVGALTATGPPPGWMSVPQFILLNAGAALLVSGGASGLPALLAAGGATFLVAILLLGAIVVRARRGALHLRHRVTVAMYLAAVGAVLAGTILGVALGTGVVRNGQLWVGLRGAHLMLNVLGWVSITIAATLVTLIPTVLRARMASWAGRLSGGLLVGGTAVAAAGLPSARPLAAVGGVMYALGVAGVVDMVRRVLSTPRRWPVPVSGRHLLLALVWFAGGSVWLAVVLPRGPERFADSEALFVVIFLGGWVLQTLLGAWLYLLPMSRPAHPDRRRRFLAVVEWGRTMQVWALNLGLLLLAARASGVGPTALSFPGTALALLGAGMALAKAWIYPWLARSDRLTRRWLRVWGPSILPGRSSPHGP